MQYYKLAVDFLYEGDSIYATKNSIYSYGHHDKDSFIEVAQDLLDEYEINKDIDLNSFRKCYGKWIPYNMNEGKGIYFKEYNEDGKYRMPFTIINIKN